MPDLVGQTVGRYYIIQQLGRGGMATVYKAFDTRLERVVAIKVIRRESISPDMVAQLVKRFDREAKALAQLDHNHIIRVHDFGEHEGAPYLVMQYIDGGSLQPQAGKPMRWQEAARLIIPIARALEYAHNRKLVHRDVKPSNILITQDGVPMLSDFGIAKILQSQEATSLTGTSVGIGTPEYMAPEQATGLGVDHRADIYSLGVVLYQLVTGRKPFEADTPLAVIFKHAMEPLPRPTSFNPDLPESVELILFKALAKQPDQRYQTMGELADALENLLFKNGTVTVQAGAAQAYMAQPDSTKAFETPPTPAVLQVQSPAPEDYTATMVRPPTPPAGSPLKPTASAKEGPAPAQQMAQAVTPPVQQTVQPILTPVPQVVQAVTPPIQPIVQPVSAPIQQVVQTVTPPLQQTMQAVSDPVQAKPILRKKGFPWLWVGGGIGALVVIVLLGALAVAIIAGLRKATPTAVAGGAKASATSMGENTRDASASKASATLERTSTPVLTSTPTISPRPKATATWTITPSPTKNLPVLVGTPLPFSGVLINADNAAKMRQLAMWGKGTINEAVLSPDGKIIALASSLGVYLLNGQTLEEIKWIKTDYQVTTLVISPDGKLLAGSVGNHIYIWNLPEGNQVFSMTDETSDGRYGGDVMSLAFSPDGKLIASGGYTRAIKLWRAAGGVLERTLSGYGDAILGLNFSADGKMIAGSGGNNDKTVRVWNVGDGSKITTLSDFKGAINCVAFSPDSQYLLTGTDSQEMTINIYRVSDWVLEKKLTQHHAAIHTLTFSHDGKQFASGAYDSTAKVWSYPGFKLLRSLTGPYGVAHLAFSGDDSMLGVVGWDNVLRLFTVATGKEEGKLLFSQTFIQQTALSPDGVYLVSCGGWNDADVSLWKVKDGSQVRLTGHKYNVLGLAVSPDSKMIASVDGDGLIKLWSLPDGKLIRTLKGRGAILSVAFSPDGKWLATGGGYNNNYVDIWQLPDGKWVKSLRGHKGQVSAVVFSPDSTLIASGGGYDDKSVKVWDVAGGKVLFDFAGTAQDVRSLVFSPDGKFLAVADTAPTIHLYNMSGGGENEIKTKDESSAVGLAFSPDGKILAQSSWDHDIRLYNTEDWKFIAQFNGGVHSGIPSIAFLPDGSAMIGGSFDGTIRVWGIP
jgi:WD40 repeat protein/serine/threonine protein kinase